VEKRENVNGGSFYRKRIEKRRKKICKAMVAARVLARVDDRGVSRGAEVAERVKAWVEAVSVPNVDIRNYTREVLLVTRANAQNVKR